MKFKSKELEAVMKIARAMTLADNKIEENEILTITTELKRFGVPSEHINLLLQGSEDMNDIEAFSILSNLDYERKKYVSSYLATIMVADGEIAEEEIALWKFVSTICKFPQMSVSDALDFMANL